jgi:hypothetical protein
VNSPTASQRRRTIGVVLLLISMLVAAFVGRWLFYAGMAAFAVIDVVDLAFTLRRHS